MDELAAMEAYAQPDLSFSGASGIILACEGTPLGQNNMLNFPNGNLMSNGSLDISSDSTASQSDSNKGTFVSCFFCFIYTTSVLTKSQFVF